MFKKKIQLKSFIGNYGAGQVEVWDSGTYEPLEQNSKISDEKELIKELHSGSIKFVLHGK